MPYKYNYKKECEEQSLQSLLRVKKRVTEHIEKRKAKMKNPINYKTGKPLADATKVFYENDIIGCQNYLEAIEKTISERKDL